MADNKYAIPGNPNNRRKDYYDRWVRQEELISQGEDAQKAYEQAERERLGAQQRANGTEAAAPVNAAPNKDKELTLGFDESDAGTADTPKQADNKGWKTSLFGRALPGTENWNDTQRARANQMILHINPATGKHYKDGEIVEAINSNPNSAQKGTLADLDREVTENPGDGRYRQFGGPQAAAEARHGTREAGGSEGEAIKAGQQAGAEATLKNGLEGIGQIVAAGTAALGGANIISKGAKALPGMAMAAAPLLMGGSRETPPEMPGNKEPEYDANGWYQDENGKWRPGPNAKYNEGESPATKTSSAEPPETADEETPANEETAEALNGVAPTKEDKNNLQEAAKRVLGLTGDKKKDAMKWLALAVSAAAHGWRGEPSPIVQMIIDDYQAKRTQDFTKSEREATQKNAQETREWEAANDEKKMALTQEYSKELAKLGLVLDEKRAATMSAVEFNAVKRMDNYIRQMGPDEYAKLTRAKGGETGSQQALSKVAQAAGVAGNIAQTLGTLFLIGKK